MNPLAGQTLDRIRCDMQRDKLAEQARSVIANIRYSIELGRQHFIMGGLLPENADHLLKNGFKVHKIYVTSSLYSTDFIA